MRRQQQSKLKKENNTMTKRKAVKLPPEQPTETQLAVTQGIQALIAQAIDKRVPVDTMEKLLAMRRELKAEWSREQYHVALSAFQAEAPVIKKNKIVMNKDGKTERYRYATIDSIITQLKKLIEKHGFNYSVDAKIEGRAVEATCIVTHKFGHSERSSFTVPIDPDAYMNEAQKYASALTFAKRYAFSDAFGVLTGDQDDDTVSITTVAEKPERHTRTRPYEEERAKPGDTKATGELLELSKWLKENSIPEGFVLALLKERKLVAPNLTKLGNAPPGVITRLLASRERLVIAYKASDASGQDNGPGKAEPKATPAASTNDNSDWQMRQPVQTDTPPHDLLTLGGYGDWRQVPIHFGKQEGTPLGKLNAKSLVWWINEYHPQPYKGKLHAKDLLLDAALCVAHEELAETAKAKGERSPFA